MRGSAAARKGAKRHHCTRGVQQSSSTHESYGGVGRRRVVPELTGEFNISVPGGHLRRRRVPVASLQGTSCGGGLRPEPADQGEVIVGGEPLKKGVIQLLCGDRTGVANHLGTKSGGGTRPRGVGDAGRKKMGAGRDGKGAQSSSRFRERVVSDTRKERPLEGGSRPHCPKTEERKFNLGVLNLYETHFMALVSVKYPYSV